MEADTHRIESFIDAVIAIVITILVLSLPQPATPTLNGLWDLRIDHHIFPWNVCQFP